ncbi:MAG TPA: hypothetical protein VIK18_20285 [Pirellulales bacterium]
MTERHLQPILAGIAFVLLGSIAAAAPVDDNPFGLPAPRDRARPGTVMLHGGGNGLRDEIRQEFVRLAGGHDARIVLMPSDMCQTAES